MVGGGAEIEFLRSGESLIISRSDATPASSRIHGPSAGSERLPPPIMRRSLTATLLALAFVAPPVAGQLLDNTMVPRGRVRLQASPVYQSWDQRFGRGPGDTEIVESLGSDLTDPTTVSLFPGIASLTGAVRDLVTEPFDPVLGSTSALVRQEITRVDFGADVGIFDWLTVGVVLPWMQTRSAVDVAFQPDTANANLGLNPTVGSPGLVTDFLASTATARVNAASYASSVCDAGGASCSDAQALAARAASFDFALQQAYAASPFFPLSGSAVGDALAQSAASLSADLSAAGLAGLAPLVLSGELLVEEADLARLPTLRGSNVETSLPLTTLKSLWAAGDVEVSARLRLLDNLTPTGEEWAHPGFGYRVTGRLLVRLPTGTVPDPDIPFDLGTGDGQTDLQAGLTADLRLGSRLGLAMGGYYAIQGETSIIDRVAPPEIVLPPLSTRTELTWRPGWYLGLGAAPSLRLAPSITLHGEYRFFHKARDEFELVDLSAPLNPDVLAIESGVKAHVVGGGFRYDTVDAWRRGEASLPVEIHLRLFTTVAGSGGQVPKATRVEAGLRLFRRLWGPDQ